LATLPPYIITAKNSFDFSCIQYFVLFCQVVLLDAFEQQQRSQLLDKIHEVVALCVAVPRRLQYADVEQPASLPFPIIEEVNALKCSNLVKFFASSAQYSMLCIWQQ